MKHLLTIINLLVLLTLTTLGCASASTLDQPTLNSPSNGMDELTFHTSSDSAWSVSACRGHVCRRAELRDGEQMEIPADVGSIGVGYCGRESCAGAQRAASDDEGEFERLPRDTRIEVRSSHGNMRMFRLHFIFASLPGSYEFRVR